MARNAVVAKLKARFRQNCNVDGWQGLGTAKIRRVSRVSSFELEVASRAELNRPKLGFVRADGTVIAWTGPHEAMTPPRVGASSAEILSGTAHGNRVPSCGLWSYVWSDRELVLLTARDFDAACDRAKRFRSTSKHIDVANLIEPVPRFELQLAEGHEGHAPTCFRLWIDGYKVGWPPTKDQQSSCDDLPPDTPLGAEARLPIPIYAHTYAYGPVENTSPSGECGFLPDSADLFNRLRRRGDGLLPDDLVLDADCPESFMNSSPWPDRG
jgi:hypothetical protein